jgi:hypothetical protein|tara:strand:+ start:542 stop:1129 length:588 start_codon:yes stop_codon:yes gene_type:complete
MSSLAYTAAPFENDSVPQEKNNIDRKRGMRKTIRKKPSEDVSEIRRKLMGISDVENDQNLSDFNPPPKPDSVGRMRVESRGTTSEDSLVQPHADISSEASISDGPVHQEAFQNLPSQSSEDYYRQFVPYYDRTGGGSILNRDELETKLDYLITLLEEQQDIKTGHVTEEIILFSFIGVFIIFVLDSFARAGKYVR